jgi:hypothetical protein
MNGSAVRPNELPPDPVPAITRKHFEEALATARKSVNAHVSIIFFQTLGLGKIRTIQKKV